MSKLGVTSMSSPEFKPSQQDLSISEKKTVNRLLAVLTAGTAALTLSICYENYQDFQDMAIRRDPPAGSTCTIVGLNDPSINKPGDYWFEGRKDIVLGSDNIFDVARRNVDPTVSAGEAIEVQNYGICDYPGPSYADGGRRSVVNPDNIDPTKVKLVPSSELPQSATVD